MREPDTMNVIIKAYNINNEQIKDLHHYFTKQKLWCSVKRIYYDNDNNIEKIQQVNT